MHWFNNTFFETIYNKLMYDYHEYISLTYNQSSKLSKPDEKIHINFMVLQSMKKQIKL